MPFTFLIEIQKFHFLQFNAYITTIKDMISKLESEHRGKLEQIDKMRQEQKYGLILLVDRKLSNQ